MRLKNKSKLSLTTKENLKGILFLIPFYLGLVFFYIKPIIQSILFSFNKVTVDIGGYTMEFVGWENYDTMLNKDPNFKGSLITGVTDIFWKVPIIIILALLFAVLVNRPFKGRTFVRAVFFLPVIFSSGIILGIIQGDLAVSSLLSGTSVIESDSVTNQSAGLQELLIQTGFSESLINFISMITNNFFSLIWKSGIQMLIFLAGLQSISPALYEAADVEGGNAWNKFWKITVPMLLPILQLNIVYTIIDNYTSSSNSVMAAVLAAITGNRFGWGSAMVWMYFVIIGIFLCIIFLIFKKINGKDEIKEVKK